MKDICCLFGGLIIDDYFYIDKWPDRSQDGFITGEKSMVGGCAINMAAAASNLGCPAYVISGIGSDREAEIAEKYMKDNGLPVDLLEEAGGTSGKCLVFLEPDGERTFLTSKGAESVFSAGLDEKVRSYEPKAAGVTGYYLLNEDSGRVMDCLEYLHGKGTKVLFDPSPLVGSIETDLLRRIIEASDIMTPNETELEIIRQYTGVDEYCMKGKTIVVKSGSEGGKVYTSRDGEVTSFPYHAVKADAVDTTGAGDSFSGALLFAAVNDMDLESSIELASRTAAVTVGIDGPHGFWEPDKVMKELIKKGKEINA
ncbi:MAG: carbohydrate kinase family protein [Anaerovoracaceae bacterium]|jgi:sugar/nucleoside kinase (ribokinase family)